MKTHHPSDALSCSLSKVVHICVMYIYYLAQMQRFGTKKFNSSDCVNIGRNVSLQIALIAFLVYTKKSQNSRSNVFCLPEDLLTFHHKFDCCDATINTKLTRTISLCKPRYVLV